MKNAQCKRCLQKFNEKDIYTIQQFQYRKTPPYSWTVKFFLDQNIGEWDSFCELCILHYGQISAEEYQEP
ncbi:MAG: hypothetical protein HZC29_04780 [Thaumarchaeota archaeon]|nr:hypothetical protein [Nitrososphaerota archaeon]